MNPIVKINETIDVNVTFYQTQNHQTKVLPRTFRWRGREIAIHQLGLHHIIHRNDDLVHVFDVSDSANDYRLEFNARRLTWLLVSMLDGGCL